MFKYFLNFPSQPPVRKLSSFYPRLTSICFLLTLGVAQAVWSMEDVEQARNLLKNMAMANRNQDYQGVFTYEHAGVLKAIRILHVVRDDLEYEKLLYLNGPRKEVVRRGLSPECPQAGDEFLLGMPLPPGGGTHLESHYELFLRGEDRVADRKARVIHVVPKDDMRYGYILSIDRASGLLLQSLLIGTNRRVIERFQYVDLSLEPDPEAVAELVSDGVASVTECPEVKPPVAPGAWEARWLPPGFELIEANVSEEEGMALSYTDGLSFVSIFIETAAAGKHFPPIQAQRGATVAQLATVSHQGRDYSICVVGEVPPETASKIAQFVAPVE